MDNDRSFFGRAPRKASGRAIRCKSALARKAGLPCGLSAPIAHAPWPDLSAFDRHSSLFRVLIFFDICMAIHMFCAWFSRLDRIRARSPRGSIHGHSYVSVLKVAPVFDQSVRDRPADPFMAIHMFCAQVAPILIGSVLDRTADPFMAIHMFCVQVAPILIGSVLDRPADPFMAIHMFLCPVYSGL